MTALELADALDFRAVGQGANSSFFHEAATQLRRLAAEVERLKKPLTEQEVEALWNSPPLKGRLIRLDDMKLVTTMVEGSHGIGITGEPDGQV